MKYKVTPTSMTGQSILESVERRNRNSNIAAISVQLPTEAAKEIVALQEIKDNVLELRVCEQKHIVLRPNQLYHFTVDPTCKECLAIAKLYE